MKIKRDITHTLEPLIETMRETGKDKYLPNDSLIAQIQLIYFPICLEKRTEFEGMVKEGGDSGSRKDMGRSTEYLIMDFFSR